MIKFVFLIVSTLSTVACQSAPDPISVRVYPAVLAADAGAMATAWDSVVFEGSPRAAAGTYCIAPEPLFTEWNIIAFHPAQQPDGQVALTVRLNAYGARRLGRFTAEPENQKKPLGVRIDGEWVDFFPVLTRLDNSITLYGFTQAQAQALRTYLDSK